MLDLIERIGNKLPDPALLFVVGLGVVWVCSALFAGETSYVDPRTSAALVVHDQLTGAQLARFLSGIVKTFTDFPPLGVVLVTLLGVGVAEKAGLVAAAVRALLSVTPDRLLTPMILVVAILAHTTGDAAFVLVVPLAGAVFKAAGRHPVTGIAVGFAGVSGGFSATPLPTSLDPLLQGFTQSAARIVAPDAAVNPLCNWAFTAASSGLIVLVGWFVTDKIVSPRVQRLVVDGDDAPPPGRLNPAEQRGLVLALLAVAVMAAALVAVVLPVDSPLRAPNGDVASFQAPLMQSIVPLIFLAFLVPGAIYGAVAGTLRGHRAIIRAMAESMSTMGYYLVIAFGAALFTDAFKQSNLGALVAVSGAEALKALAVPAPVLVVGLLVLASLVNLAIGSASAKWALLAPIFVPMLMQLGLSPDLTQAAYRVGDSSTNIVTPLMPYFPLVVVWAQRWSKEVGIGTLAATMLPYSLAFLATWTTLLLVFWGFDVPLGVQASYTWPR